MSTLFATEMAINLLNYHASASKYDEMVRCWLSSMFVGTFFYALNHSGEVLLPEIRNVYVTVWTGSGLSSSTWICSHLEWVWRRG